MSVWPIYFAFKLTLSPDLFSVKSTALRLVVYIYIDFAHNTLPLLKLTTGSSEPILITTEPSSNPTPIILPFYLDTSADHPIPKLYSNVFNTA